MLKKNHPFHSLSLRLIQCNEFFVDSLPFSKRNVLSSSYVKRNHPMLNVLEDRDGLSVGHALQDLAIDRKNFIPCNKYKIRFVLRLNILAEI